VSERGARHAAKATGGDELIAALYADASRKAPQDTELAETHISWVLLTGPYAYKIKKPVRLPFLDFSSLESRRFFCEEELRLNRRLSPTLYLAVVPIGGTPSKPCLEREPAIEYAVKMRRFAAAERLDHRLDAGAIEPGELGRFAERLAGFHAQLPAAPRGSDFGTAAAVTKLALDNVAELADVLGPDPAALAGVSALGDWTRVRSTALAEILAARRAAGAIKEGHGDLHLENLAYVDGEILPFDALEFAPGFRWGDVISEAAFLAMDLMAHEQRGLAFGFLDRYLGATGDYGGTAMLRFYLVYRALVRAKAGAIKAAQHREPFPEAARDYLELASALTRDDTRLLAITHGLSGSGKTHVSSELLARLPALRVRSDVERQRLGGRTSSDHGAAGIGQGLYAAETTALTYARLAESARHVIQGGFTAIVDAAFLAADERRRFAQLAAELGAAFVVLDCAAPNAQLRARIRERSAAGVDASEATESVLEHQLRHAEPLDAAERAHALPIDTGRPVDYAGLAVALKALAS